MTAIKMPFHRAAENKSFIIKECTFAYGTDRRADLVVLSEMFKISRARPPSAESCRHDNPILRCATFRRNAPVECGGRLLRNAAFIRVVVRERRVSSSLLRVDRRQSVAKFNLSLYKRVLIYLRRTKDV